MDRSASEDLGWWVKPAKPLNGYLDDCSYQTGWQCKRGYRIEGRKCTVIKTSKNGYLGDTNNDLGWKCNRGYRAAQEACIAMKIPQNAHIDYSGSDWECNKTFTKSQNKCVLRE